MGRNVFHSLPVALYPPNLVGYLRICLLGAAVHVRNESPQLCAYLFLFNFILDAVDGILARWLETTSGYGAFLDVLIDNWSRGILWVWAFPGGLGATIIILEMTVFVCTHKGGGSAWKDGCFKHSPWWIQSLMGKNFKTPGGALMVSGLMGLPLWCWMASCPQLQGRWMTHPLWLVPFLPGRVIALCVEAWVLLRYFDGLLQQDARIQDKFPTGPVTIKHE